MDIIKRIKGIEKLQLDFCRRLVYTFVRKMIEKTTRTCF